MGSKTLELGSMEFTNEIRVSDPCYDKTTWCNKLITNARPGLWKGYALKGKEFGSEDWGERIQHIAIVHESVNYEQFVNIEGKIMFETLVGTDADIGVDSGQAGFFREDCFGKDKPTSGDYEEESKSPWQGWYDAACVCSYKEIEPEEQVDPIVLLDLYKKKSQHEGNAEMQAQIEDTVHAYRLRTTTCSEMTASKFTYKGKDQGFNGSSGYGDGSYPLYVHKVEGQIVTMFVPFTYGEFEEEDDE